MTIRRMNHVGVVVDDLEAAVAFFTGLGFTVVGDGSAEGEALNSVIGLEGARTDFAMLEAPEGRLELIRFHAAQGDTHQPANARGLRHLAFEVDDLDATLAGLRERGTELVGRVERFGSYRLCYVSGPEGILVELAEQTG